ncbi:MAG: hypothetical protein ACRDJC_08630 [Thermomicrobiales bacterium]
MSTETLRGRMEESTMSGRFASPSSVDVDIAEVPLRDRIRWGPIIAGVVTAFAVLLFLTVVGIALGLSALGGDPNATPQGWGTAAGIWGGLTLLIAFFVGGWLASRAAAPPLEHNGVLNGFITGAATLLLILWLATTAITGALGFFAGTISTIAGAAPATIEAIDQGQLPAAVENPEAAVEQAGEQVEGVVPEDPAAVAAEVATENVAPGAWGTAIAMLLAVGASALGGMVGQSQRTMLPGSRTVVSTT